MNRALKQTVLEWADVYKRSGAEPHRIEMIPLLATLLALDVILQLLSVSSFRQSVLGSSSRQQYSFARGSAIFCSRDENPLVIAAVSTWGDSELTLEGPVESCF